MDERDPRAELRDLEKGLERARQGRLAASPRGRGGLGHGYQSGLALAFRIGLELVIAVVVGVGIGWAFDRWLGTRPWGMILFFFLGVATGMVNVYRAIPGMGMAIGYKQRGGTPPQGVGYDDEDDD